MFSAQILPSYYSLFYYICVGIDFPRINYYLISFYGYFRTAIENLLPEFVRKSAVTFFI